MAESPSSSRTDGALRDEAGRDEAGALRRRATNLATNVCLAAATVVVLLLVFELTLRLSGFSYVLYPEEIEFGRPEPVLMEAAFEPDPDLFWTRPGYAEKLQRLRALEPALVLLGDSCTAFARYDERLAAIAATVRGVELRHANLAVPGWSSYQGRRQMERDVPALAPEVVTIYFGWNDHWIGFGIEDETVARVKRVFGSRWGRLRLAQLATKTMVAWGARETAWPERVSLDDYGANLRAMVGDAREIGAVPLLLTAPSGHRRGEEPPDLGRRWLRDVSELVPLHERYVEATREVASATGAPLCDLAARAAALSWPEREALFTGDGIHLSEAGEIRVARWLDECLGREGLWDRLAGHPRDRPASPSPRPGP